ncbi:hypothetical protein [Novosphingobium sp.]|uniref:hypothetical protein n=1 Tax=Novosphingobium sp. TaxID=1874826 RepID=UPI002B47990A|nr:hypothetical protein [Novosphingobium sp.]HKR93254.1 hypothetical protein [Novosphingobium sp.]
MDRDRRENSLDSMERVLPATGGNDTGDMGDEEARILSERKKLGSKAVIDADKAAPEHGRPPGRNV